MFKSFTLRQVRKKQQQNGETTFHILNFVLQTGGSGSKIFMRAFP